MDTRRHRGAVRRAHLFGARRGVPALGRRLRLRARVLRPFARVPLFLGGAVGHPAGSVRRDRYHCLRLHATDSGTFARRHRRPHRPARHSRRAAAGRRVHPARRDGELLRDSPRRRATEREHSIQGCRTRAARLGGILVRTSCARHSWWNLLAARGGRFVSLPARHGLDSLGVRRLGRSGIRRR